MLAYLLWHWPAAGVSPADYERSMLRFHQALASAHPQGFLESAVYRVSGAPWAAAGGPAYEDWYLLEGSAAMDVINELAVSGERQPHHDAAALAVEGAAAGLYQLRLGSPDLVSAVAVTWAAKPKGMGYPEFFAFIEPWTSAGDVAVLRRQMVLGPTPEFCFLADRELDLPLQLAPLDCRLDRVA